MPDIPTLTSQAEQLARAHGFWNAWSVFFVALTAIAAVLYFIGQWMTIRRGNDLNAVQTALIRAKDEVLARDLKDKDIEVKRIETEGRESVAKVRAESDEKIAGLTAEAERAKTERAEADKQIAIAKADAARAKEGTAIAEARSLEASAEVSRLQPIVANAEQRRAEAEKALLELQQRARGRQITPEQESRLVDLLKNTPKYPVSIEVLVGSDEAQRFGEMMEKALRKAGWTAGANLAALTAFTGVLLIQRSPGDPEPPTQALYDALTAIGLSVKLVASADVAEGTLTVRIGSQP